MLWGWTAKSIQHTGILRELVGLHGSGFATISFSPHTDTPRAQAVHRGFGSGMT